MTDAPWRGQRCSESGTHARSKHTAAIASAAARMERHRLIVSIEFTASSKPA